MPKDPIKSLPWLQHGDVQITPAAVDAAIAFDKSNQLTRDGACMTIGIALHNFIESYKECPFFVRHSRHSMAALARAEDTQMDYESILHLHAARTKTGWVIGTPAELPLPEGYEQERVMDEARLLTRMADEQ